MGFLELSKLLLVSDTCLGVAKRPSEHDFLKFSWGFLTCCKGYVLSNCFFLGLVFQ